MVCFWRRRVHDKSATEYGAGWFAFRGGEAALYVKNSVDLQWARSGEKRYQHMLVNNAENPVRFLGSGRVFSRAGFDQKTLRDSGKHWRDAGFDQKAVRDSGKRWRDAGFDQKTGRDSGKHWRDAGFDQETVRDSGKRWQMRDLTASREAEFAKRHGCGLRKKMMFGMAMAEVRDVLFSWKCSRNSGSGIPVSRS